MVPPDSVEAVQDRSISNGPTAVAPRFVGALGVGAAPASLKAARPAPQLSDAPRVALAEICPALAWNKSSEISLVFGGAGIDSSIVYPLPAVKIAGLPIMIAPNNKSPFAVVVRFPLLGFALVPCCAAIPSSEFDVATPEYSKIAKRIVPDIDCFTVIVFAPPAMFSA